MSLAIIGTDTEVGKTVVSAVVLQRYASLPRLAYWKPVATGAVEGEDTATVRRLVGDGPSVLPAAETFREPLSPHLAARLEGRRVNHSRLLTLHRRHEAAHGPALVVEGIGGLLVPLDDDGTLLADLLARMALPCLLVARSTLGTINHTLLTLEAARARGLELVGVVLNGPPNPENRLAIRRFGDVPVLGELPPLPSVDARSVTSAAADFDADGVLSAYLARAPAGLPEG